MKSIKINVILLMLFYINISYAQEVIGTSGGFDENSNFQISWTIGEPMTETFQGSNLVLTQGFHQSFLSVTEISSISLLSFGIKVYPNPVHTYVNLSISDEIRNDWIYRLFSLDGKLLTEKQVDSNISRISMQRLVASNYILKVYKDNSEIIAFKIVKTQ
ncbi:MAG: T9SS type A sorting domain-containing protein [Prolixibacteraceae bacterium]|nr:T9SS type A sorting domain-containing protein [Prolixibacteraceae bacterium]MBN2773566.1 T9SS type A sorting domain-containing protein [Prolixibacteraceae bacterium]